MSSVQRSMAKGAAWMVLARGLDRALGFVSTLVLARLLAPDDFGIIAMAMSFIALLDLLRAVGLDVVLIQHPDPRRIHYDTAWTLNLIASAGVSAGLVALAWPASAFFNEPELTWVMIWLASGPLIESLRNVGVVDFRRNLEFDREFRFMFYSRLARFLVTIPLAFALQNHWALVGGMLFGRFAEVVLSYAMHPFRPRVRLAVWRELFSFSKWLLMKNLLQLLMQRMADFVIGRMAGARALGLFTVSTELALLPSSELSAPINRALLPGFARQASDRPALRRALLQVVALICAIAIPVSTGLMLTAHLSVPLLLGEKWLDAVPVVIVMAIYGLTNAVGSSTGTLFLALGKPRIVSNVTLLQLLLLAPALYVGVSREGAVGAAWAYVASALVVVPLSYAILVRTLRIPVLELFAVVWRPLVATGLMIAAVYPAGGWLGPAADGVARIVQLSVLVPLGAAVYLLAVLGLWAASGRPAGAERMVFDEAANQLSRLRRGGAA